MTIPAGRRILLIPLLLAATLTVETAASQSPEINAKQALLWDMTNNRDLLAKNEEEPMPPSSMAKMMAHYMIFDALGQGTVTIFTPVRVSRRAAQQPGSGIELRPGEERTLGILLQASIVYSANDATVALAEHMARSEADFARLMTEKAKSLGLERSIFANATGFTHRRQQVTARDLARLSARLINDHDKWYRLYATDTFHFRGKNYDNRNPVLGRVEGADGIKTGQTRAAGFGMVASAVRYGRRLILVINGLGSAEARAEEATRLLEWGFQKPVQGGE